MSLGSTARHLVAASHPGPTVVVTALGALLGRATGLPGGRLAALTGAVLSGQLTIGWTNDLIDRHRDRRAGRADKPLAAGALDPGVVRSAIAGASAVAAVLSSRCGKRAGVVHGVLVVGSGWAYNLGLKRTPGSFAPYAVAFGALPQVATLSGDPPTQAPWSRSLAGALLGVSAHFLNVLPDLDEDRHTGVRGLPHRLSERQIRITAAACLAAAGAAAQREIELSRSGRSAVASITGGLGAVVACGRGSTPFYAAAGGAIVDTVTLILAARRGGPGPA